jgi:GR25 family glycosyltransferase involved in LPS biosynthesis
VLKRVIELVVERLQSGLRRDHKWWVWYHTGPHVWTWALMSILEYPRNNGRDGADDSCALGQAEEDDYDTRPSGGYGVACATEILQHTWLDPVVRQRARNVGICLLESWDGLVAGGGGGVFGSSAEWVSRQFAQHASHAVELEKKKNLVNIPIYWINGSDADSYEERKRELSMHIQLDGLEHYRVAAMRWDVDFIEKPNFLRVRDHASVIFSVTEYEQAFTKMRVEKPHRALLALPNMGPAVACTGSHFKAIGLALSRGHPAALIMEDDMILDDLLPYWDKSLGALITELEHEDPDWEMIQIWSNHHYEHMEGGQQRPFSHVKRKVNHPLVGDSTGAYILSRKGMEKVISTYQGHVDAEGEVHGLIVRATTGHMVADIVIFEPLVNHMYIVRNPLVMHHCPRDSLIGGYLAGQLMFTDLSIAYQYELMAIPRPPSCVPREPQCGFACKLKGAILV